MGAGGAGQHGIPDAPRAQHGGVPAGPRALQDADRLHRDGVQRRDSRECRLLKSRLLPPAFVVCGQSCLYVATQLLHYGIDHTGPLFRTCSNLFTCSPLHVLASGRADL